MNSLFILFSVIRSSISEFFIPDFLPDEIGVGNYRVMETISCIGADSYIISILNLDTEKLSKFKVVSDEAGYIKIAIRDMNNLGTSKRILNLMIGIEFSVVRTEKRQGRELLFAKW